MRLPRFLWDAKSREYFDKTTVHVEASCLPEQVGLSSESLLSLSGAPAKSEVSATMIGECVQIVVVNDDLLVHPFQIDLIPVKGGSWDIKPHYLRIVPGKRRSGLGGRMFACTALAASRLRFRQVFADALHSDAALGSHETLAGIHASLALGYDAAITDEMRESMPSLLRRAVTMQDVLASDSGISWWKSNPQSLRVYFDLKAGSNSMQRLRSYMKSRSIRIAQ